MREPYLIFRVWFALMIDQHLANLYISVSSSMVQCSPSKLEKTKNE